MSKLKALSVSLAMLLGAGTLAVAPASASPFGNLKNGFHAGGSDIELVRMENKNWRYDRGKHGHRSRWRDRDHSHFSDGFWYTAPFWALGTAALLANRDYYDRGYNRGDAHVEYCLDRYRSYDVETDSFLGYDGDYHRCNSPYN